MSMTLEERRIHKKQLSRSEGELEPTNIKLHTGEREPRCDRNLSLRGDLPNTSSTVLPPYETAISKDVLFVINTMCWGYTVNGAYKLQTCYYRLSSLSERMQDDKYIFVEGTGSRPFVCAHLCNVSVSNE